MKFPFTFGTKLVFRLIFPGVVLAAGVAPLIHTLIDSVGIAAKFVHLFPIEVIFWGWVVVLLDMQIYMAFEGRRYWPQRLWKYFFQREQRRLRAIESRRKKHRDGDRRKYLEASTELSRFPMDENGEFTTTFPTRLGNLIAAYESYPQQRYGLDAAFFWFRIFVKLEKDLREELDSQQALVDSALYLSFAFMACSVCLMFYSVVVFFDLFKIVYIPNFQITLAGAGVSLLIGLIIYRISLHAHAQFGECFKAVFDQYRSCLNFDDIVQEVSKITGDSRLWSASAGEKNMAVWRYLNWYRVKPPGQRKTYTPAEWRRKRAEEGQSQNSEKSQESNMRDTD